MSAPLRLPLVDPSAWAKRILDSWRDAVAGIVRTGQLLAEAKAALPHGEFTAMVREQLPFTPRTAQRLMRIGAHPVLADPTHGSLLPVSWRTLDELAKLPEPVLRRALADGRVRPDMRRDEAHALRPEPKAASREPMPFPAQGSYGTILADPSWLHSGEALEDLLALSVEAIAAEHAHLLLWTPSASVDDATKVVEAWGFEYQGTLLWVRAELGSELSRMTGVPNWHMSHERHLLLGTRGFEVLIGPERSWFEGRFDYNGVEPAAVRSIIERVSPAPRIELFARECADGWDAWGNEV